MLCAMYPILLDLGPLKIGSYGVLLACAFLIGFSTINWQFKKNKQDLELAWDIYFLALLGGMLGSRLLFIFENFSDFLKNPTSMIFSTTGFSVLGGYALAFILCYLRVRYAKVPFFGLADCAAPGLAVGYAVGRLGCIAAGDGCYGIPTKVGWGMSFPNGLVSTLSAKNPMLVKQYAHFFPGEPIPTDICVHPTPIYESISSVFLLIVLLFPLWKMGSGKRSAMFLCWFGVSRFFIEYIRLNPIVWFGLTSGQLMSILFFVIGIGILLTGKLFPHLFPHLKPAVIEVEKPVAEDKKDENG